MIRLSECRIDNSLPIITPVDPLQIESLYDQADKYLEGKTIVVLKDMRAFVVREHLFEILNKISMAGDVCSITVNPRDDA